MSANPTGRGIACAWACDVKPGSGTTPWPKQSTTSAAMPAGTARRRLGKLRDLASIPRGNRAGTLIMVHSLNEIGGISRVTTP
jgi:hypothetical protein